MSKTKTGTCTLISSSDDEIEDTLFITIVKYKDDPNVGLAMETTFTEKTTLDLISQLLKLGKKQYNLK